MLSGRERISYIPPIDFFVISRYYSLGRRRIDLKKKKTIALDSLYNDGGSRFRHRSWTHYPAHHISIINFKRILSTEKFLLLILFICLLDLLKLIKPCNFASKEKLFCSERNKEPMPCDVPVLSYAISARKYSLIFY